MDKITISDYKPLVEDIKDKINKRQFQVLKAMNAETINLYWEIGEEIYRTAFHYYGEVLGENPL